MSFFLFYAPYHLFLCYLIASFAFFRNAPLVAQDFSMYKIQGNVNIQYSEVVFSHYIFLLIRGSLAEHKGTYHHTNTSLHKTKVPRVHKSRQRALWVLTTTVPYHNRNIESQGCITLRDKPIGTYHHTNTLSPQNLSP